MPLRLARVSIPLNLLCVLVMGLFSYCLIEKPFLGLKDRFHKQRSTRTASTRQGIDRGSLGKRTALQSRLIGTTNKRLDLCLIKLR
jgi:peptidoglycan/LPS O-acetylase OafA/YrhL